MAVQQPSIPIWNRVKKSPTFKEAVIDIWNDNPVARMVLALCPAMGATNMAINGFTQGLATMIVTIMSSITISLIRNFIPAEVRIPVFMVVIAGWVTGADITLKAYFPDMSAALGPYVPLIITNCFVMGRANAFAIRNKPWLSAMDAVGVGIGFTLMLTLVGVIREVLGFGTVFGIMLIPGWTSWVIAILPTGAFIVFGLLVGIIRQISPNENDSSAETYNQAYFKVKPKFGSAK